MTQRTRRQLCVLLLPFGIGQGQLVSPSGQVNAKAKSWEWVRPGDGIVDSRRLELHGAVLQVDFAPGALDLAEDFVLLHIQAAASAVIAYYGRFPVSRARVLVVPVAGRSGIVQGTTWGAMDGFQGFTRIRLGQHATAAELAEDWVMTHELVHLAFPNLPDDQLWMEEGLATYVEPLARVKTGELMPRQVWQDMVQGMPKGLPGPGDRGLDRTHTWGRTYWGGALFCLVADVAIRHETGNRRGLQDALRAVVVEGGTIDREWALGKALEIGDRATGTHVLAQMYAAWKDSPVQVDLQQLWNNLGIRSVAGGIEFVPRALMANVREAIAGKAVSRVRADPDRKP